MCVCACVRAYLYVYTFLGGLVRTGVFCRKRGPGLLILFARKKRAYVGERPATPISRRFPKVIVTLTRCVKGVMYTTRGRVSIAFRPHQSGQRKVLFASDCVAVGVFSPQHASYDAFCRQLALNGASFCRTSNLCQRVKKPLHFVFRFAYV